MSLANVIKVVITVMKIRAVTQAEKLESPRV